MRPTIQLLLRAFTILSAFSGALACGDRAHDEDQATTPPHEETAAAPAVAAQGSAADRVFPLQAWMKANATSAIATRDSERLVTVLRRAGELAPTAAEGNEAAAVASWREIARLGSEAAARGDLEGARKACKQCHDAHRESYRVRFRNRPLPGSG